jgi:hypothetical protein
MSFTMFRIEHAKAREIAQSTIKKYYKKTKIILSELNDLTLNWKKICKKLKWIHMVNNSFKLIYLTSD